MLATLARDMLIGVDVGGTFTDAVLTVGGESYRAKSPSTYPDIGRGVLQSCRLAAESAGLEFSEVLPRVRKFGGMRRSAMPVLETQRLRGEVLEFSPPRKGRPKALGAGTNLSG